MKNFFDSLNQCQSLLDNDFDRGYLTGCAVILLVILVFLAIRIVFSILFRVRRCRTIVVPSRDGDVIVSYTAISNAVEAALKAFPAIKIADVLLYRQHKSYFLRLICSFNESGDARFPGEVKAIKTRIFDVLHETFGIESVKRIGVQLEAIAADPTLHGRDEAIAPAPFESTGEAGEKDRD